MPRPKLKSDDEVLEAATAVLKRRGPIDFTLSDVAKEVGLSRAALIQRFTNRDTLALKRFKARIWSGGRVRGPRGIRAEGGREGDFVAVRAVRRMPHRSFV